MSRICLSVVVCILIWFITALSQDLLMDLFEVTETEDRELLRTAQLSPSGTTVSWSPSHDVLCLLDIVTGLTSCRPLPDMMAVPVPFRWSSDGQFLAGSEDVFRLLRDPDIWVVDVATESIFDCTDDGVWGGYFGKELAVHWIDFLPTWDPATGDLLFFRSESADDGLSLDLMRLSPAGFMALGSPAEPEVVVPLSGVLPSGLPFLGHPAISPDSATMAFIVLANTRDNPANGIWVLDLTAGTAHQLAGANAFRQPATDWHDPSNVFPVQVAWTSGGDGLAVLVTDLSYSGDWVAQNICYLDPVSRSITFLFSYAGYQDREQFFAPDEEGHTGVFRVPRQAILTRDSRHLISVHTNDGAKEVTFVAQALPPHREAPRTLGSIPIDPRASQYAQLNPQLTIVNNAATALVFSRYLVSFAEAELNER